MGHPLFGPEVRALLQEGDAEALRLFGENLHPSTVAETLCPEEFGVEEVWKVLGALGPAEQAAVFEYFPAAWQVTLAAGAGKPMMARLIEKMSHDDRVDLLRRLSPEVRDSLLRLVDEVERRDIASLIRFEESTVGYIMTTDYAWLPIDITAGQAIGRIRLQAPDRETIYYIYILDEPTRRCSAWCRCATW
jgi:magnesium transporter